MKIKPEITQIRFIVLIILCLYSGQFLCNGLTFTINSPNGYTLTCTKATLTISVNANTTNSISCTWQGLLNGTVQTNPLIVSSPDNYTITVQDLITLETSSQTIAVSINTVAPNIIGTNSIITMSPCPNVINSPIVFLSPSFPTGTVNYIFNWVSSVNWSIITPVNESTVYVSMPGTYTCIATNTLNGCKSSIIYTIDCITSGINENNLDLNSINIFPNPVTDKINIRIAEELKVNEMQISVINMLGQTILQLDGCFQDQNIDFSIMPSGVYLIKINYNNQILSQFFIK